jgi:hypothetical protein
MSLDLQGIKNLFAKGIDYVNKSNHNKSIFFSDTKDYLEFIKSLADKATDLTTLMNAISMSTQSPQWCTTFKDPKSIPCGNELQYTGVQFGYGNWGWYFFYGIAGNIAFNLSFFRLEIAPPEVCKKENIQESECVRWSVLGGYGNIPTIDKPIPEWHSIPSQWVYMKYNQPSYSTFSLTTIDNNSDFNCRLASDFPLNFTINLDYKDTEGARRKLDVNVFSRTQPLPNAPNGCECGFGLGSWYYSYVDCDMEVITDITPVKQTGRGWIDHQLIKSGIANTMFGKSLQTLTKTKNVGWLWFAIQDDTTGLQYMLIHHFGNNNYVDDIVLNKDISINSIIVYKKGVSYINPSDSDMDSSDIKVQMIENIDNPSLQMKLPSKYKITLPGGKNVVLSIATAPNVYPNSFAAYETPAILYDENGVRIGQGLIEANFYLDNETLAKRYLLSAGGDVKNLDVVSPAFTWNPNVWRKILAILIILIPVWLILFSIVFIMRKKDKRKERAMLSVALMIIILVLLM